METARIDIIENVGISVVTRCKPRFMQYRNPISWAEYNPVVRDTLNNATSVIWNRKKRATITASMRQLVTSEICGCPQELHTSHPLRRC